MKYTDKEIIEQVKKWNFGFICVNSNAGYSGLRRRLIKVQHRISKEIITCQYREARINNVKFPKYNNIKAINELNRLNYGWNCLESWIDKRLRRKVKLKHIVSKEIITCYYGDAKRNSVCFPKYENISAKNELNKLNYGWICLKTYVYNKTRMAKIQHRISEEVITCYFQNARKNNVKFPKYNNINAINELNKFKYEWNCLDSYIVKKIRMAKIQHPFSKEIITVLYSCAKRNSVRFKKYENMKRFDNVNQFGSKSNPQYVCVSSNCGNGKGRNLLVSIKRKDGLGQIKVITYNSLLQGTNPYNEDKNRVELNEVQPMYERFLKKLNIDYIKEFNLGRKRIDFMFIINKKRYGLEVKQSGKKYYSGKNQIANYKKLANLRQYKLEKVFLSDPQGKHKNSISIKELESLIKTLK